MVEGSRTLVTGAGGFIGAHLCRLLASRGERFIGTLSLGSAAPPSEGMPWPAGSFRPIDLRDSRAVRELLAETAPTRIFNLAAIGTHPLRQWDAADYVDLNVRLPASLSECMPQGCVLVQIGSMAQYRGSAEPLNEDTASRDDATLYSWSKNAADSLLESLDRATSGRGPAAIRVRLFGVMGGGEPSHRLLPSLVRACLDSADLNLSDGTQIRDMLHVQDAVAAMVHASEDPSLPGKAVNVGRGEGRPVRWIVERAAQRLCCSGNLRFGAIARRAYEAQQHLVPDVSRLRATGWRPRWSFEESIDRAVDQMVTVRAERS